MDSSIPSLEQWFASPSSPEGTIDDLQLSLAVSGFDPPSRSAMVKLLKAHGWRRVHRSDGYTYVHSSIVRRDSGAIYGAICRVLREQIAAAQLSGEHQLVLSDLRKRVAELSHLKGNMGRADFDAKFDRALEAMLGSLEGWGFERVAGPDGKQFSVFSYRPTKEQAERHMAAGLTSPCNTAI